MIHTNKDVEVQINYLKREIESLRRLIHNGRTSNNGLKPVNEIVNNYISNQSQIDSELTADSNTVIHRLMHLFEGLTVKTGIFDDLLVNGDLTIIDDLTVDEIKARLATLRNTTIIPQLHLTNTVNDNGTFIMSQGSHSHYGVNCAYNGSNWIAKASVALLVEHITGTGWKFYYNTGLTPGNSFTPTVKFTLALNGDFTAVGNINGVNGVFSGTLNSTGDITTTANINGQHLSISGIIFVGGVGGVTEGSFNVVTLVNLTANTIFYKDHAGVNQTMNVITNVTQTVKALAFTGGIRTI